MSRPNGVVRGLGRLFLIFSGLFAAAAVLAYYL